MSGVPAARPRAPARRSRQRLDRGEFGARSRLGGAGGQGRKAERSDYLSVAHGRGSGGLRALTLGLQRICPRFVSPHYPRRGWSSTPYSGNPIIPTPHPNEILPVNEKKESQTRRPNRAHRTHTCTRRHRCRCDHQSPITTHPSPITHHQSPITNHPSLSPRRGLVTARRIQSKSDHHPPVLARAQR